MDSSVPPKTNTPIPLERWLRELQSPTEPGFLLGGTGHLILSETEQAEVRKRLMFDILPRIFPGKPERELLVLTGLAPGADHLFSSVALEYLGQRGIAHRVIGLLPLPIDTMLDDWSDKAQALGTPHSMAERERQRAEMHAERAACDSIVHLMPPGTSEEQLNSLDFRQLQYQRLAACLAEQSDVLVAILRKGSVAQPGGTAEVVNWRRHPEQVPAKISTLALRHHAAALAGPVFVVDPDTGEIAP
jgi:hypothetical protein